MKNIEFFKPFEHVIEANHSLPKKDKSEGFDDVLGGMIGEFNANLKKADESIEKILSNEITAPHEAMIQLEEANLLLKFTLQARSKAIEAYNEVMRMQV